MDDKLVDLIAFCLRDTTRCVTSRHVIPKKDPEYQRLCAIRRRAERKALRTKTIEDLRASRRAQRHIRRHLNKLHQHHWRSFCATLNVRQPLTRILRTVNGMRKRTQQLHPFTALSLHERASLKEVAEEYCKFLSFVRASCTCLLLICTCLLLNYL